MSTRPLVLLPIVAALAGSFACTSTLTGNEGNLSFAYPADDAVLDFNKPIAVGARLDLSVSEVGVSRDVTVLRAAFDDPTVLAVVGFEGKRLTVEGRGEGQALLEVEARTASGPTLPDSVDLQARVPDVHRLWNSCTEGAAAYLVGQAIYLPYEFERSNGQPVIGYGWLPLDVEGPGELTFDATWTGQQYAKATTDAVGAVTLTSQVDGTTIDFDVVAPADLDGVETPTAYVAEDIDVGDTNLFTVKPLVGGAVVCQADIAFTVESDTPDICTVELATERPEEGTSAGKGDNDLFAYEAGWYAITGEAEGTCRYTVTYPEGDDGAGVSAQFTYPIEP